MPSLYSSSARAFLLERFHVRGKLRTRKPFVPIQAFYFPLDESANGPDRVPKKLTENPRSGG